MPDHPDPRRWRQLALLATIELLAMALWFSASAIAPALKTRWGLADGAEAWLTIAVQLGFVAGALASAVLNLSDRIAGPRLIAVCAALGAAANLAIPLGISDALGGTPLGFTLALLLRGLTGMMLAGVYPTGMKLMATWFRTGRGLAIGILVGALTVGSASPHLFNALLPAETAGQSAAWPAWRTVMLATSATALAAALLSLLFARTGPYQPAALRFDWTYFLRVWREPALRRANFGYLGHMFELYAMWAWAPQLLLASYAQADLSRAAASLAGFATVAIGGVGCVLAGFAADRAGRSLTTVVSLVVSGGCALVAGALFDQPLLLTAVCLVWGFAVVADSAQFSAAVSELCDPRLIGTALTIQTCAGFLLTTLTIRAVPAVRSLFQDEVSGWWAALALLALGPAFGTYHMLRLRGLPEAEKMAGGRR
jgi:MFS family permease